MRPDIWSGGNNRFALLILIILSVGLCKENNVYVPFTLGFELKLRIVAAFETFD